MDKIESLLHDRARIKELILYVFFGVLTTLVNLVCYWLLTAPLKVQYQVASVISWIVAVLFAYIVNKLFVFESRGMKPALLMKEMGLFFGARLSSLLLFDLAGLALCVEVFHINDFLAKLLMNVLVVIYNYIASKLVIFQKRG